MDALRQELQAVFEAEYRDHLGVVRGVLARGVLERAQLSEIFRRIHSLKGAARAVENEGVERLSHALETVLHDLLQAGRLPDEAECAHIGRSLDGLDAAMERDAPSGDVHDPEPHHREIAPAPDVVGYVQVPLARLDALVLGLHTLSAAIERRDPLWARLDQLFSQSDAEFSKQSEASRRLHEGFRALMGERADIAGGIERALASLRIEIQSIALVQAGAVFENLAGMARQIARDYLVQDGHRIDPMQPEGITVTLGGMDLRADRHVLQSLRDPVIQLLRNAIVHGGERWASARRRGELATLHIELSARLEGNRLRLSVADDGRGPDLEAIRRQGLRQGVLHRDEHPNDTRLLQCVFEPGFSTRGQADELAGRGFGLSIVAESVRALSGEVRMVPRAGGGTEVIVLVPLSRRARTVLLVEAAGQTLGIGGDAIGRLVRLGPEAFHHTPTGWLVDLPGIPAGDEEDSEIVPDQLVPVLPLAAFLSADAPTGFDEDTRRVVVALDVDGVLKAVVVDHAREVRDLVVSDPRIPGLDRALTPDLGWLREDWPTLVVDEREILRRWDSVAQRMPGGRNPATPRERRAHRVLVVDDSVTTRTLEKTILQAHGYDVVVATDGAEALAVLRREGKAIEVVITDVEMPRMDGFALLQAIREDPMLEAIPVIIMTSRNETRDIRRGMDGGARAYITKQAFEQGELIETIRGVL